MNHSDTSKGDGSFPLVEVHMQPYVTLSILSVSKMGRIVREIGYFCREFEFILQNLTDEENYFIITHGRAAVCHGTKSHHP